MVVMAKAAAGVAATTDGRKRRIAGSAVRRYSGTDMDFDAVGSDLDGAPDEALLIAFANGDAASGRALLNRLAPRLFAHAARLLRDRAEAEDVVQEAMLRLWKIAPDWRQGEAKVSTWMYRVVSNLCIDRLRKSTRNPSVGIDNVQVPAAPEASQVERLTNADRARAVEDALNELPERQRQAVILRHLDGLSNPEIAEVMDIGVEAVESLIARGKRALSARLAGRKEELGYSDG